MTVSELIRELQKFPPDTLVLKYRPELGRVGYWETMDGIWFQMVSVVHVDSPHLGGRYVEPKDWHDGPIIDALEI